MTMDCTDIRNRLHAYLDQELDPRSATEVDRHVASCAGCNAALARQSALRSALRSHATYHDAPAGLARRIRARLGAKAERKPWFRWHQWLPMGAAVAATALLSWTAAIQYVSVSEDEATGERVIAGHARSVVTGHVADVASSDQHSVKPWLSSRLDYSPPVTDLTGAGFPLVGGRLDYLDQRPVAVLVYRHREHMINLFVWPLQEGARTQAVHSLAKRGYNVLHWNDGGMAFWAVSDLNAAEMRDFAGAYAAAK
jgi:mycothiol system anti-sigma-R factor